MALHLKYAEQMAQHPFGHALYHPKTVGEIRPGLCGYFDHNGQWQPVVDLTDPSDLKRKGFSQIDLPEKAPKAPFTEWGPKTSSNVKTDSCGTTLGISAGAVGAPVGGEVEFEFSSAHEYGAVLLTAAPIEHDTFYHRQKFLSWCTDNQPRLVEYAPEVTSYDLWIVTGVHSTPRCSLTVSVSRSHAVKVGFGAEAVVAGKLSACKEWQVKTTGSGWIHAGQQQQSRITQAPLYCNYNDRVVVFISGLHFRFRPKTLLRKDHFHESQEKRGLLDTILDLPKPSRATVLLGLTAVTCGLVWMGIYYRYSIKPNVSAVDTGQPVPLGASEVYKTWESAARDRKQELRPVPEPSVSDIVLPGTIAKAKRAPAGRVSRLERPKKPKLRRSATSSVKLPHELRRQPLAQYGVNTDVVPWNLPIPEPGGKISDQTSLQQETKATPTTKMPALWMKSVPQDQIGTAPKAHLISNTEVSPREENKPRKRFERNRGREEEPIEGSPTLHQASNRAASPSILDLVHDQAQAMPSNLQQTRIDPVTSRIGHYAPPDTTSSHLTYPVPLSARPSHAQTHSFEYPLDQFSSSSLHPRQPTTLDYQAGHLVYQDASFMGSSYNPSPMLAPLTRRLENDLACINNPQTAEYSNQSEVNFVQAQSNPRAGGLLGQYAGGSTSLSDGNVAHSSFHQSSQPRRYDIPNPQQSEWSEHNFNFSYDAEEHFTVSDNAVRDDHAAPTRSGFALEQMSGTAGEHWDVSPPRQSNGLATISVSEPIHQSLQEYNSATGSSDPFSGGNTDQSEPESSSVLPQRYHTISWARRFSINSPTSGYSRQAPGLSNAEPSLRRVSRPRRFRPRGEQYHVIRGALEACDECSRRRVRCDPSHRRPRLPFSEPSLSSPAIYDNQTSTAIQGDYFDSYDAAVLPSQAEEARSPLGAFQPHSPSVGETANVGFSTEATSMTFRPTHYRKPQEASSSHHLRTGEIGRMFSGLGTTTHTRTPAELRLADDIPDRPVSTTEVVRESSATGSSASRFDVQPKEFEMSVDFVGLSLDDREPKQLTSSIDRVMASKKPSIIPMQQYTSEPDLERLGLHIEPVD